MPTDRKLLVSADGKLKLGADGKLADKKCCCGCPPNTFMEVVISGLETCTDCLAADGFVKAEDVSLNGTFTFHRCFEDDPCPEGSCYWGGIGGQYTRNQYFDDECSSLQFSSTADTLVIVENLDAEALGTGWAIRIIWLDGPEMLFRAFAADLSSPIANDLACGELDPTYGYAVASGGTVTCTLLPD